MKWFLIGAAAGVAYGLIFAAGGLACLCFGLMGGIGAYLLSKIGNENEEAPEDPISPEPFFSPPHR